MTIAEILKFLFTQLSSGMAVTIAVLAVTLFAVFKLGSILTRFGSYEGKLKDVESFPNKLYSVERKLEDKFGQHDRLISKIEVFTERFIKMEAKFDTIYMNNLKGSPVQSQSPISLTTVGHEIVANLNAAAILAKYRGRLLPLVEASSPQNAYDIQVATMKACREDMLAMLDANELDAVKNAAFQRGIQAEDVMMVFGVMLRDEILKEKGIPVADVDTHDPQRNRTQSGSA